MREVQVLVNYGHGLEVLGAFTDKALIEEFLACPCQADGEDCEILGDDGSETRYHELGSWTVAVDDPRFVPLSEDGREHPNLSQVHVLSNGFGEILGAFTDKALLEKSVAYPPEDKCRYCESYESRHEACPYRESYIDTVVLDDPGLIQDFKDRIAQFRDGIREVKEPVQ